VDLLTCAFAICGVGHQVNYGFAICRLIITILRICGLAHLRILQICDCGISPRMCGFAICGLTKIICVPTFVVQYMNNILYMILKAFRILLQIIASEILY
jgi:hypothetical protein